jgi:hypothetical protein
MLIDRSTRTGEGSVADGVQIDTDGVGDFANGMRHQADGGFAAARDRGVALHAHGVEFGSGITSSSVITDAKRRYAQALENTEANLKTYHMAAGVLAEAAGKIAQMFASTDMNSAQAQQKIDALIGEAIRSANEAMKPTGNKATGNEVMS